MNPSLILFLNIVAWAWVAYSTTALLFALWLTGYMRRRGQPGTVSLHWWTIPSLVMSAAWLSVFSGLSFGG